ncbi:FAD-dependent oxidoreductase [Aspergillus stella-maris]|uniref:FAD-dependent oxidoreductase n=1 Tax=Aspergillus stella-maris TaxID=1810926 RepID=UPI003CCDED01
MAEQKSRFRVVIVGGSIAGLTLAHCLLRQNVDFVVLESHQDIAPQVGASTGIIANGARILGQLGCFDDILAATEPLQDASFWNAEGKLIAQSNTPQILENRHGYPTAFVDRQVVLEVLYKQLGQWQDHIFTGKRVVKIDHHRDGVKVHCADGSVVEGDLVVGADGVRSIVRRQMWDYMDSKGLQLEASKEREAMVSEYSCVFGISTATPGLVPGTSHRTFGQGWSFLTIIGREGRVYWFFFKKFDRKYAALEIPRFDQTRVDQYVAPYLAITNTLLPLEEACFQRWAVDRWTCIGDSVHKMTPNMGQGGNSAIESAAALGNSIAKLLEHASGTTVSMTNIDKCMQSWQKKRLSRVQRICHEAHGLAQLEALDTIKHRLIGLYLLPYLEGYLVNTKSKTIVEAAKIDYLPPPARSLACNMQFTDSQSKEERSILERALWVSPLVGIAAASTWLTPLVSSFRLQMLSFMTDLGPIYGIWLLERYRNAHSSFEVLAPLAAGTIFQLIGIYKVTPFYLAQEYIRMPLNILLTGSNREIKPNLIESLVLATITGYHTITFASFFASTCKSRQWYNALWQVFPLTTPLLQGPIHLTARALRRGRKQKTQKHDQQKQQRNQKPGKSKCSLIRFAYITFGLTYGLAFIYARFSAIKFHGTSFTNLFIPTVQQALAPVHSFSDGIARFMRFDEAISMASGFVWLALRFRELDTAGARIPWAKSCCAFVASLAILGPGATLALGWGWREEVMSQLACVN